jgi:hypothetical protein
MRLLSETKARKEVDELVGRYGWDDLGNADRGIYATSDFVPIAVDLEPLRPAAEIQLNWQQPAPAASLKAVLKERKLRAEEGTKSNDYTKGIVHYARRMHGAAQSGRIRRCARSGPCSARLQTLRAARRARERPTVRVHGDDAARLPHAAEPASRIQRTEGAGLCSGAGVGPGHR